ncbi:hypothetical protein KKG41_03535 [Patescibacteria group bacterium]|nr:hypothetical protein [Patescibacteria group bacterium]MBU1890203.1 hypothetical protein [Patescibacteria group bacterium]
MSTSNHIHETTERELEKKAQRRQQKKKPKIKMSGRSVIQLKQLIAQKAKSKKTNIDKNSAI